LPLEPSDLLPVQVVVMVHAIPEGQAIDMRNLRKVFGNRVAVDDVSIQIFRGEILGFMGHNGAGKTTTIRMLLGLLAPTRGSASILGYDIVRESLAIRRLAGCRATGRPAGMIQKVTLAQALINDPRVLLLDKPTAGLDPLGRHETLELIRDLATNHGVTVLFSTHILTDVERICERVAILHHVRRLAILRLTSTHCFCQNVASALKSVKADAKGGF